MILPKELVYGQEVPTLTKPTPTASLANKFSLFTAMLRRWLIAAKPIPEALADTSQEPMTRAPTDVGPGKPLTFEISAVDIGAGIPPADGGVTVESEAGKRSTSEARPGLDRCSEASILLVEDNLVNQMVVISLLRKKGYQLDVANNGQEALDRLSANLYRLILMDIQMPVLDGLEATRRIRENPAWASLPIVAMTAHAMNGDRERCLQAGMSEYLAKPVDHNRLLKLVEQYLAEGQPTSLPVAPNEQSVAAATRANLAALDISVRAFGASQTSSSTPCRRK